MDTELAAVVILWSLGALVALGVPAFLIVRERLRWQRLPHTRALVAGDGPPPASQDLALLAFIDAWKERGFGGHEKLRAAMPKLHIAWRVGRYFTMKDTGELKMTGRTVSPKSIVVAIWEGASLGDVALFHELTHWALWVTTGEPDADHEEERYKGWTPQHTAMIVELKSLHRMKEGRALKQALTVVGDNGVTVVEEPVAIDESVRYCGTCDRVV